MLDAEDLYQEYPEVFDFIEKSLEKQKYVPATWLTRHFTNTKVVLEYKTRDELYLEVAEILPQLSEPFIKFLSKIITSPESFNLKYKVFIDNSNNFKLPVDVNMNVINEDLKFTTLEVKLLNMVILDFYCTLFAAKVNVVCEQDKRTEERKHFDKIYGGDL